MDTKDKQIIDSLGKWLNSLLPLAVEHVKNCSGLDTKAEAIVAATAFRDGISDKIRTTLNQDQIVELASECVASLFHEQRNQLARILMMHELTGLPIEEVITQLGFGFSLDKSACETVASSDLESDTPSGGFSA